MKLVLIRDCFLTYVLGVFLQIIKVYNVIFYMQVTFSIFFQLELTFYLHLNVMQRGKNKPKHFSLLL